MYLKGKNEKDGIVERIISVNKEWKEFVEENKIRILFLDNALDKDMLAKMDLYFEKNWKLLYGCYQNFVINVSIRNNHAIISACEQIKYKKLKILERKWCNQSDSYEELFIDFAKNYNLV